MSVANFGEIVQEVVGETVLCDDAQRVACGVERGVACLQNCSGAAESDSPVLTDLLRATIEASIADFGTVLIND